MKKLLITLGYVSFLMCSPISADALKNSLNNLMGSKDSSSLVNLDGLGLSDKPKKRIKNVPKKRSSNTVIAKIKGHKFRKKDADAFLKKVTKGKVKDYDKLPKKQQKILISELKKIYKANNFQGRPGSAVIGHYNDKKKVYKKEADAYIKKVTKGKIKDIDRLPRKQRLLVLKDLQRIYAVENFKSRPATAVVAIVNKTKIYKKEADSYLLSATNGRIKDFDKLLSKQRLLLIEDLARPIVIKKQIEIDLTEEEKDAVYKQMWAEKQQQLIKVNPDEMLALYELKKEKALAVNPQSVIPPYIALGEVLRSEVLDNKIMQKLMKDVNITINYESSDIIKNIDINQTTLH